MHPLASKKSSYLLATEFCGPTTYATLVLSPFSCFEQGAVYGRWTRAAHVASCFREPRHWNACGPNPSAVTPSRNYTPHRALASVGPRGGLCSKLSLTTPQPSHCTESSRASHPTQPKRGDAFPKLYPSSRFGLGGTPWRSLQQALPYHPPAEPLHRIFESQPPHVRWRLRPTIPVSALWRRCTHVKRSAAPILLQTEWSLRRSLRAHPASHRWRHRHKAMRGTTPRPWWRVSHALSPKT